jgi:predicted secreted acid phosphatase
MWKQINPYYLEKDGWTISKMTLANGTKYGLWEGNVNKGFFDTADEAKQKYESLSSKSGERKSNKSTPTNP